MPSPSPARGPQQILILDGGASRLSVHGAAQALAAFYASGATYGSICFEGDGDRRRVPLGAVPARLARKARADATIDAARPAEASPPPQAATKEAAADPDYPDAFLDTPVKAHGFTVGIPKLFRDQPTVRALVDGCLGRGASFQLAKHSQAVDVLATIEAFFRAVPVAAPSDPGRPHPSLLDLVDGLVPVIGTRNHAIVRMRLTGPPGTSTLQGIANAHGLTREGVRQVVLRAIRMIVSRSDLLSDARRTLDGFSESLPQPVAPVIAMPWSSGLTQEAATDVTQQLSDFHVIDLPDSGPCYMPVSGLAWKKIVAALDRLCGATPPIGDVGEAFAEAVREAGIVEEHRPACLRALRLVHAGWSVVGLRFLFRHLPMAVAEILGDGGAPVHIDEVVRRIGEHMPAPPERKDVGYILGEYAIHVGGERYVSRTRSALPHADAVSVAARCRELVGTGGSALRWRAESLIAAMREAGDAIPVGLDADEMQRVLAIHTDLVRLDGLKWTLPGAPFALASPEDVATCIVEAYGAPMPYDLLREAMRVSWGERRNEQVFETDVLVRVDFNLWGLMDRDIRADDPAYAALGAIAARLVGSGRLTLPDALDALRAERPDLPVPTMDAAAAVLRVRYGIRGRKGIMREAWRGPVPRPGSIAERVLGILGETPDGISIRDLAARVSPLVDTPFTLQAITKAVAAHGTRRPGAGPVWFLRTAP